MYRLFASMVQGPYRQELRTFFANEIPEELTHAQLLADKISALGGSPAATAAPVTVVERCQGDARGVAQGRDRNARALHQGRKQAEAGGRARAGDRDRYGDRRRNEPPRRASPDARSLAERSRVIGRQGTGDRRRESGIGMRTRTGAPHRARRARRGERGRSRRERDERQRDADVRPRTVRSDPCSSKSSDWATRPSQIEAVSPMPPPTSVITPTWRRIIAADPTGRGAERHAKSDLPRSLRDRVGEHTVETDGREDRRQAREGGREHAQEPIEKDVLAHLRRERPQVFDRQVRIEPGDDAWDRGERRVGVGGRPHVERSASQRSAVAGRA